MNTESDDAAEICYCTETAETEEERKLQKKNNNNNKRPTKFSSKKKICWVYSVFDERVV